MYIYNITFAVDKEKKEDFLRWLNAEFVAVSLEDKEYFYQHDLLQVCTDARQGEALSIALQMRAAEKDDIDRWYQDHGSRLFDHILNHYNGAVVFFTTTLKSLDNG